MPNYRRFRVPGATVFFTLVTHERRGFLADELARRCLREAIREVQKRHPFEVFAIVLLPDHVHAIWILPPGESDFSARWRYVKGQFSRSYLADGGEEGTLSPSRVKRNERGVWQRRFFEHTILDERDLEAHADYVHYNPVKHGCVARPADWPYSSFHRWVDQGHYDPEWGRTEAGPLAFPGIDATEYECE
ncbi:Transposase IS200 like protein [Aquisphaera giovannonii]|uniref:Transposase IS200 like protein n=1 Tax=Aquisphaera giovannonii TaxID=406548 RepID=A0A5B9VVF2_9BACT|nr:transposase [Aquisphaera giovannonii]QEH31907.1 Transposase IS200 like protein [Aquisphaera giovannonii]